MQAAFMDSKLPLLSFIQGSYRLTKTLFTAKVFYEVIVPLLEVENTALICISTPQDSMNFYSEMFTLKTPDGKPLFNTLEVSLVCAACKASENPERCPHMSDEVSIRNTIIVRITRLTTTLDPAMEIACQA